MPKLNRDGVEIYYEVHGEGPPVLLTHGYSASARTCGKARSSRSRSTTS